MIEEEVREELYWRKELQSYQAFIGSRPGASYSDCQPTKWQALLPIAKMLTERYGPGSALELGCGSATLLLQLAAAGWRCMGVDRSASAISMARAVSNSLALGNAEFRLADFYQLPETRHDLVFSIGVIEHLHEEDQLALLDLHFRHSTKAVLIGIPNLTSPVFRSFIEWARRNDRLYEEPHQEISVPGLAKRLGRTVQLKNGAHLFLGRGEYFIPGDDALAAFYAEMNYRLTAIGGARYASFPHMDFDSSDIAILARVEQETCAEKKQRFGFINYFLLE